MNARPIRRMGTSVGMAGGSLAEGHDAHQPCRAQFSDAARTGSERGITRPE